MTLHSMPGDYRARFKKWALFAVPLTVLLGMAAGQLAGPSAESAWFGALVKPAAFPPPAVFGIVWTVLYAAMGLAAAMVCALRPSRYRALAIIVFVLQLVLNLAWPFVFFKMHLMGIAFGVLLLLAFAVGLMLLLFWKLRPLAGAVLVPYFAWVLFAAVLNGQFLQHNPLADGVPEPAQSSVAQEGAG